MSRLDVAVLGGGIIGCAIADELARQGRRVALIERGRLGREASSAAAGILSAQMDLPQPGPLFDLCQAARRMHPGWVRRIERRVKRSVGLHRDGILYIAATARQEQAMAARAAWQHRRGLRVERLSPAQVRRQEPSVDRPVRCGFYFPTECQVDNARLMQALGRACRASGVVVREHTSARRLIIRRGAVQGIETDRGAIQAPVVVSCLGSWSSLLEAPPVKLPVVPARGQMMAFRGPKGLFRSAVMSERAYVVQRRDGRLLVGSTIEFAGFDKSLTLEGMHGILCGLRHLSSALERCTFLEAWTGLRPYSPDGLPLIGPTSVDGLYVATGHFRHGILLAPITAALLSRQLAHDRPLPELAPFSPARF